MDGSDNGDDYNSFDGDFDEEGILNSYIDIDYIPNNTRIETLEERNNMQSQ